MSRVIRSIFSAPEVCQSVVSLHLLFVPKSTRKVGSSLFLS